MKGPACWIVQGYQNPHNGYVQIAERKGAPMLYAHRVAYELAHGPIPPGLYVLHACDTPNCVNPAHLSVGTQKANVHDAIHKGRRNAFGIQKLHPPQVREIRRRAAAGELQKDIARAFGVARNTVCQIVNRVCWAHLTDDEPMEIVFERVPHVVLPVRGELHVGQSPASPAELSMRLCGTEVR